MEDHATLFKPRATARRPLLGTTILLIEDSRYCAEAVRLMSLRSGARLRRADSLKAARRHLSIYRPDVVMVDIGLPDGSGIEIIKELRQNASLSPAIVALSGNSDGSEQDDAMKAGADSFLSKPLCDIVSFQNVVKGVNVKDDGIGNFAPQVAGSPRRLNHRAFIDDLGQMRKQLKRALPVKDKNKMQYLAQFASSVAQTAQDRELMDKAAALTVRLKAGRKWQSIGEKVLDLLEHRLAEAQSI